MSRLRLCVNMGLSFYGTRMTDRLLIIALSCFHRTATPAPLLLRACAVDGAPGLRRRARFGPAKKRSTTRSAQVLAAGDIGGRRLRAHRVSAPPHRTPPPCVHTVCAHRDTGRALSDMKSSPMFNSNPINHMHCQQAVRTTPPRRAALRWERGLVTACIHCKPATSLSPMCNGAARDSASTLWSARRPTRMFCSVRATPAAYGCTHQRTHKDSGGPRRGHVGLLRGTSCRARRGTAGSSSPSG